MLKPDRKPIVSRFSRTESVSINPLNVSCVFVDRPQGSSMSTYWKSPYNDETITQLDTHGQLKTAVLCSTAMKNKVINERLRKNKTHVEHVHGNRYSARSPRPKSQLFKSVNSDQEIYPTPRTQSRMSNPRSSSNCNGNKTPIPVAYNSDFKTSTTPNERCVSRNLTLRKNKAGSKQVIANKSFPKLESLEKKYGLKSGCDFTDSTFVSDNREVTQNSKVTCKQTKQTNQTKDLCFSRCSDGPLEGYSPSSLSFTAPDWSVSSDNGSNSEHSSSDKENVPCSSDKTKEDESVNEDENASSDSESKVDTTQVVNNKITTDLSKSSPKHTNNGPRSTTHCSSKNGNSDNSNVCSEADTSPVTSEEMDTLLTSISKKTGHRKSCSELSSRGEDMSRGKKSPRLFVANKVNCLYDKSSRKHRKTAPLVEETTLKFAFDNGRISGKTIENTIGGATVTRSHIRPIMFAAFLPNHILPFKSCRELNNGRINFCDPNKTNQIVQWLRHVKEVQTREGLCMKADSEINANE